MYEAVFAGGKVYSVGESTLGVQFFNSSLKLTNQKRLKSYAIILKLTQRFLTGASRRTGASFGKSTGVRSLHPW